MAQRPVLQYGGNHRKRGEDARNRVISRVYGGGNEQQSDARPVLEYKGPQNPLPSSFSGDPRSSMLNMPHAINNFQEQSENRMKQPEPRVKPASIVRLPVEPMATITNHNPAFAPKGTVKGQLNAPTLHYEKNALTKEEWLAQEAAARDRQLKGAPGIIKKPLQMLGHGIDIAQANIPGLADFQQGAGNALGIQQQTAPSTGGVVGKLAKGAGSLAGYTANPAALEQNLFTGGYGLANGALGTKLGQTALGAAERGLARGANLVNPALNRAGIHIGSNLTNKLAERAVTGGIANAYQNAALEAAKGNTSAKDVAMNASVGGVFGAAGDVAAHGIGKAFMQLFKRNGLADNAAAEEVSQILNNNPTLALPEGRKQPGTNVLAPNNQPILGGSGATTARIAQRQNPWRDKYNQLIGLAHEYKFTPGREMEELEQLWSSIADKEDPSLDDLIKLAHPTRFNRAEEGLVSKARQYQQSREAAGAPLPVRTSDERLGATPETQPAPAQPEPGSSPPEPVTPIQQVPDHTLETPAKPVRPVPEHVEVADDLIPDDPENVSVRVRDKVNSFADGMLANARAELAKSRNRLSSNPADIYGQYAKIGAAYMLKGAVKLADFTEAMVKDFGEDIRPHVRAIFKQSKDQYKAFKKQIESQELGLDSLDATKLKDLTNINLDTADVYRNFKKVFGTHYDAVKKAILDPFDKAKGAYASEQKNLTDKLYNEVVKKFGINKGSRLSALVQKYGERMMDDGYKKLHEDGKLSREMLDRFNLEKLKEQEPRDWQKIVAAEKWFRAEYNRLIDRVNESVSKIYPNRPEKLVPKRSDYFHHFKELTAISAIQNLFDSASGKINATLSGVSPFTQPKAKFAGFKQKRGMGEFKNDAVGGFLKYIPAASYSIHIDPHIAVFRNLAKRLGEDTEKTGNINNFKAFLENYANDLAGKTSDWDRWMHRAFGRKGTNIIMAANNRVKSNLILGSLRSTLAQTANIPQGIAFAKHHSVEGALRTLDSIRRPNFAMNESDFIRERYVDKSFRRFNTKMLEQPRRFAEWMMETVDRVGTSFVWNSAYAKGKALKVDNPVKYADEHTRRLVSGRGVGEVPLLQKTKTMQLFAPFQLEVANLWRVMKDFVSEKDFVGLATLFAANFLLNKGIEKTTGSGVTFDPIEAVIEASGEDMTPLERGGRVGGEILSNLPGGQTLAAMYPEYGLSRFGIKSPTRKELFGDNDPTRFGTGLVFEKGVQDPLFLMALPFGGNQLKKTIAGAESLVRGGSYKETTLTSGYNVLDKNELKFKVNRDFKDTARALAFGPTATGGGQEYYNKERRPLSEKQTEQYRRSSNPDQFYDRLMKTREIDTDKRKIGEIAKDKTLKPERRKQEIDKLQKEIRKISSSLKK